MKSYEIIDDIEKVIYYPKDEEGNIIKTILQPSLVNMILDVVNSKKMNILEKRKLFREIVELVGLLNYELD